MAHRRPLKRMIRQLLLCIVSAVVNSQSSLDCSFEAGNFCNWYNGDNDDFDWKIANNVKIDGYHSIPRTLTGTGNFVYAQGSLRPQGVANARAELISPAINALNNGGATLSFVYWKAAIPPVLQVCYRVVGDSGDPRCIDTISGLGQQRWVRRVVTIPDNPLSFNIILQASNFNSALDTLGIDDIKFQTNDNSRDFAGRDYGGQLITGNVGQGYGRAVTVIPIPPRFPPNPLPTLTPYNGYGNGSPNGVQLRVGPHISNPYAPLPPRPVLPPPGSENQTPPSRLFPPPGRPVVGPFPTNRPRPLVTGPPGSRPPGSEPTRIPVYTPRPFKTPDKQIDTSFATLEPSRPGACIAVSCQFSLGYCRWYNDLKANFNFRLKNRRTQFQGIVLDSSDRDSYAYVNGAGRNGAQRGALRSPAFVIPKDSLLEFYVYISDSVTGRLALYNNDPFSARAIIWQAVGHHEIGGLGWKQIRVALPATSRPMALIFVADQMTGNQYVGIDDVRLINLQGQEIGCASDAAFIHKNVNEIIQIQRPNTLVKQQFADPHVRPIATSEPRGFTIYPIQRSAQQRLTTYAVGVDRAGQFVPKPVLDFNLIDPLPQPPLQISKESLNTILQTTHDASLATLKTYTARPDSLKSRQSVYYQERIDQDETVENPSDSGWVTLKPQADNTTRTNRRNPAGLTSSSQVRPVTEGPFNALLESLAQEVGGLLSGFGGHANSQFLPPGKNKYTYSNPLGIINSLKGRLGAPNKHSKLASLGNELQLRQLQQRHVASTDPWAQLRTQQRLYDTNFHPRATNQLLALLG